MYHSLKTPQAITAGLPTGLSRGIINPGVSPLFRLEYLQYDAARRGFNVSTRTTVRKCHWKNVENHEAKLEQIGNQTRIHQSVHCLKLIFSQA